uniref:Uncharacterized protein n=1 Tax=Fagus sylvatica TaxID=28930 RepID=A0A2N9J1C3_FAGSY
MATRLPTHRNPPQIHQPQQSAAYNNPPPTTDPQANHKNKPTDPSLPPILKQTHNNPQIHPSSKPTSFGYPVERNTPRRDRPNPGPRVGSRSGPCTKRPGGDLPRSYRGGWDARHASDNVNKILIGNKADMDESKRAVPTSKGQALADEYGIKFFETSAKTNLNVEEVFFSIARDIKQRLADTDSRAEPQTIKINQPDQAAGAAQAAQRSACCGS